jgi:maltokinase
VIDRDVFGEAVARYLPQQRWFAGDRHALARVEITELEILQEEWPILVWAIATGELKDGSRTDYQILAGVRPLGPLPFLEGVPTALMGEVPTERGPGLAYNALHDIELARVLLTRLAPDEDATYVRQLGAEVATSILVFDERLLLRIFRRLRDAPNPDVETVRALAGVGFRHVASPIAGWRRGDVDLAVLREFVAGGAEGWQLALTSLRDLADRATPPDQAPGDFGPEIRRMGAVTARLHAALAQAFDERPADAGRWAARLIARLEAVESEPGIDGNRVREVAERMRSVADPGRAIRIHGDYQLRRVMRTDQGWYVLGFEGERPRSIESAIRFTTPLEDLASMLRSLEYAGATILAERADDVASDRLPAVAAAWEAWNGRSFLDGYLKEGVAGGLLPGDESERAFLLSAFELLHALREVHRERDGRLPLRDVAIPAVNRLLDRIGV